MAIQVTNRVAHQALRGQSVTVTLDSTEALNDLPLLSVGLQAGIVSTGYLGLISRIDEFGNTFDIKPLMPSDNLSSTSTPGFLAVSELINITT